MASVGKSSATADVPDAFTRLPLCLSASGSVSAAQARPSRGGRLGGKVFPDWSPCLLSDWQAPAPLYELGAQSAQFFCGPDFSVRSPASSLTGLASREAQLFILTGLWLFGCAQVQDGC